MSEPITFLMADASRLFRRAFDAEARSIGITGQQWRVLAALARHPGIKQGQAADLMEVEPITLSRMIDRLQESGMVERRADPADRRAWCLYLTDQAIPLVEDMRAIANRLLEVALEGFTTTELASFADFVDRFRNNVASRQIDNDDRKSEATHATA
ncbi:MarR family transcriptional regulator [Sphingomonas lacunae]|uniref:MarR family transcriptional regulator n=1 Tax=Sphingomonas lacunae TaxID=2698828 RepID=A0A6M4AVB0_9SPHN|nr:MarR family transcriptional regulator [Sphingomonas lacunae]QJQ33004.1 MarR family transcriptional regulator [Sphingomonas lacunae]